MDTLQTQWSWLLQITKCIQVHLKENAAYSQVSVGPLLVVKNVCFYINDDEDVVLSFSQFFKEANETYSKLQKQHETIRTKFPCDKNTQLENLLELLKNLEVQMHPTKSKNYCNLVNLLMYFLMDRLKG